MCASVPGIPRRYTYGCGGKICFICFILIDDLLEDLLTSGSDSLIKYAQSCRSVFVARVKRSPSPSYPAAMMGRNTSLVVLRRSGPEPSFFTGT